MSQNYDSPQSELSEIEPNEIHHQSNLLMRDLMFGTFFTQLSMGVNKALFLFLAIFFAYRDWSGISNFMGLNEYLVAGLLVVFYFVFILVFIFFFGVIISAFTPMIKKGVLGKHEFIFNSNGITESTEYNKTTHKYKAIGKVFTRFGNVYIQVSGMQWHILPKRDFSSSMERDALLEYLKSQLNT